MPRNSTLWSISGFRAAEPSRAPGASSYAQADHPGDRFLAAGRPVSDVTCIYADFQRLPILMAHFLERSSSLEEHDMAIPYYHVDAFTGELFAGNPAGVCILSAFLADSIMQKIAAEDRHSETAFVVPRADGDFDLRWFTPLVEDDLCGRATLASAYVLALRKRNVWPVRFHTRSGMLTVAQGQL
jgi:hypothetical protein